MLNSASTRTYSTTHTWKETYIQEVKKNNKRDLLCTYPSLGGSLVCWLRRLRTPAVRHISQKRLISLTRDLQKRTITNSDFWHLNVDGGVFCKLYVDFGIYAHLQCDTYVKRDLHQKSGKETKKKPTLHLSFCWWVTCMLLSASTRTCSAHMSKETYIPETRPTKETNKKSRLWSIIRWWRRILSLICSPLRRLRAPAARHICQKRPISLKRDIQKRPIIIES